MYACGGSNALDGDIIKELTVLLDAKDTPPAAECDNGGGP